jgi:MFS family permease
MQNGRLIAIVFLPFAAGYYLSYLFRSINAPISAHLTSDLALGAADLGLLTSVYFLTFAAAQIPIGVLLDRYGPRRIQSGLLLVAAVGAVLFGMAETSVGLVLARAMIGLGVAAALMAGLKAIVLWFPRRAHQQPYDHARHTGRGHRNGAHRAFARLDRLAWALRTPRSSDGRLCRCDLFRRSGAYVHNVLTAKLASGRPESRLYGSTLLEIGAA